jgi:feruloyl esterase
MVLLASAVLSACGGSDSPVVMACDAIVNSFKMSGVTIASSTLVTPTGQGAYCRIEGSISPEAGSNIKFATNIPQSGWNGRFVMNGNGGYAGGAVAGAGKEVSQGYATAATDTGHTSTAGTAFYNNRIAEVDYGYRAVHLTTEVSKELIKANRGSAAKYAYFNGCSTGGRQALVSVQRYPNDFDGVVAGAPAHSLTNLAVEQNWSLRQFSDNNFAGNIQGKVALISAAVKAQCADAEGLVSRPGQCQFDPAVLQCATGQDTAQCLTPAQVAAVKAVYQGPRSSTGTQWYEGKPRGTEDSWALWLVADSTDPAKWSPAQGGFGFSFVNNLFFEVDPPTSFRWNDFNFDTDPPKGAFMASILNATDPNIGPFKDRGGKLLMYHGLGDGLIAYQATESYLQNVRATLGAAQAEAFTRLYLVPGMDHCDAVDRGGLQVADWLTPVVNWVEKGEAPAALNAVSRAANPKKFTRPVCAWPQTATYKGSGDRLDGSNWACTAG